MRQIDFSKHHFSQVIHLPNDYAVFDLTRGYDEPSCAKFKYSIGKYDEDRVGVYPREPHDADRTIHMGLDIGALVGTPIHAFFAGEILFQGDNPGSKKYGFAIVTRHVIDGVELFALFAHLSRESISRRDVGDNFEAGDILATIGPREDNGDWNPHLHFQLSYDRPTTHNMKGVVTPAEREWAREVFPDPRLVLGRIY